MTHKMIAFFIACFPFVLIFIAIDFLRDAARKLFHLEKIGPELIGVPDRMIVPNKPRRKSRDPARRKAKRSSSLPEIAVVKSIPESFKIEPWMELEAKRREIFKQADYILYLEHQSRLATRRIKRLKSWVCFLSDKSAKMMESGNTIDAEISELRYENKNVKNTVRLLEQEISRLTAAPQSIIMHSTAVITTKDTRLVPQPEIPEEENNGVYHDSLCWPPNPVDNYYNTQEQEFLSPQTSDESLAPLRDVHKTLTMDSGVEVPSVPDNTLDASSKPELVESETDLSSLIQSQSTLKKSDEMRSKKKRRSSKRTTFPDEVVNKTVADN